MAPLKRFHLGLPSPRAKSSYIVVQLYHRMGIIRRTALRHSEGSVASRGHGRAGQGIVARAVSYTKNGGGSSPKIVENTSRIYCCQYRIHIIARPKKRHLPWKPSRPHWTRTPRPRRSPSPRSTGRHYALHGPGSLSCEEMRKAWSFELRGHEEPGWINLGPPIFGKMVGFTLDSASFGKMVECILDFTHS